MIAKVNPEVISRSCLHSVYTIMFFNIEMYYIKYNSNASSYNIVVQIE